MKKIIKSATSSSEYFHPAIESFIYEGDKAGYNITVDGDDFNTAIVKAEANEDKDRMPKLTLWFDTTSSGDPNIIYYQCKASYPEISTENLQYADTAEYLTDKWNDVAKFITWMMNNSIYLDEWEDE